MPITASFPAAVDTPSATAEIPPATLAYLSSDRISPPLLALLRERALPDAPNYRPRTLSARQFATLRALIDEVIPQDGSEPIDLAARLDTMMADKEGNGWRYEALPADPDAYQQGLDTLEAAARADGGESFAALGSERRVALLRRAEVGELNAHAGGAPFDAAQIKLWFEELRSDAVRLFVAHPATLARMGYSGTRNGREGGVAFTGFERIAIGERESFEPAALTPEAAS